METRLARKKQAREAFSTRRARALGMLAVWITGAIPAVLGLARCPSAVLLHRACPGCGTTRAMHLLLHGDVAASLAMHPLAAPSALATALIAVATVRATLLHESPMELLRDRFGRVAVVAFVAVNAGLLVLWIARALGAFGGLPPV